MVIVGAIAGGSAAAALTPWLAIPGGILGMSLMIGLVGNLGLICGIVETLFYTGVTFVFSGGLEPMGDTSSAWIKAGVVTVLFSAATYSVWNSRRA